MKNIFWWTKNREKSKYLNTVQVISLARSSERRAAFAKNNPELDFQFRDAVDGQALVAAGNLDPAIFAPGLDYAPGAYGISASVHQLLTEIAAGEKIVTIAEDDAIFRSDFHSTSANLLQHHPDDFDFIAWGYNFTPAVRVGLFGNRVTSQILFSERELRASLAAFSADLCPVTLLRLRAFYGTCAYSVSPSGAREMLDRCFPLTNDSHHCSLLNKPIINGCLDVVMSRHYAALQCFMAYPPLAVTPNVKETSTIWNNGELERLNQRQNNLLSGQK